MSPSLLVRSKTLINMENIPLIACRAIASRSLDTVLEN